MDNDRDYYAEALRILAGTTALLPQIEHLQALRGEADRSDEGFRALVLREAAMIARESYPKDSDYDVKMKIAAGSIAGTLERMAERATSPRKDST